VISKTCVSCGKIYGPPFNRGRCDECTRTYERQRAKWRGKTAARGYDARWRHLVELAIRAHAYCADCGHTGDKDNPLTGDHIIPRADGGPNTLSNVAVRCRRCNSSRQGKRRERADSLGRGPVTPAPSFRENNRENHCEEKDLHQVR
jgi:5-methylcytosine-specific restriction endonuclease McrA